jgi:hypothetical protein
VRARVCPSRSAGERLLVGGMAAVPAGRARVAPPRRSLRESAVNMSPGRRCDEIIALIDAVLADVEPAPMPVRAADARSLVRR